MAAPQPCPGETVPTGNLAAASTAGPLPMPDWLVEARRPTAATLSAGEATPQAQAGLLAVGELTEWGEAAGSRPQVRPPSKPLSMNIIFYLLYIKTKNENKQFE